MKRLFLFFVMMLFVCINTNAQESNYTYLNDDYNIPTGLNIGYSSEKYLKIGGKLGYNKIMGIIDVGIMTSPPKIIKNNENGGHYNNYTLNFGLAYTILPKFYIGVLGGFNRIIYNEIDGYEIKNVLNKTNFNCGFTLGCIIKNVDLSISYFKTEQFSIQIGFLFGY